MQYLLLIYGDEAAHAAAPPEARDQMYAGFGALTRELADAGRLGPAAELKPSSTARTLRIRDGQRLVTDGPFVEAREQLGGFFLIEAADMDEALGWAAKVPSAPFGTIEVRPIAPGPPSAAA